MADNPQSIVREPDCNCADLIPGLEAITLFNRGYTMYETSKFISSLHGHPVMPSTIARWVTQHPALTTYRRLRIAARRLFSPARIIRVTKLYHRQVYEYAYHRAKLAFLREGSLDRRAPLPAFSRLADFLESLPTHCPHDLFGGEGARSSSLGAGFLNAEQAIVIERDNVACQTAALIIPSVGSNFERHSRLQRFMLANDAATIAVEVPVWLNEAEIDGLERQHAFELVPKVPIDPRTPAQGHLPRSITGHIDFLQVRQGCLHILDYKPDARTNRPLAQLVIYALALTVRVPELRLFDIKCAWFNEHAYNEIFPRKLLAKRDR